jgi:non-homologous end joining protein Ku
MTAVPKLAPKRADNVVDLMSALRASIKGTGKEPSSKARPAKKAKPTRRKAG